MSTEDHITIVGSSYFQPIADLIERLVRRPMPVPGPVGSGHEENGYSNAITMLLVATLESYTARLRFVRPHDVPNPGNKSTPDLLAAYFTHLPTYDDLLEVFMLRNLIVHNHVWHHDASGEGEVSTIATPQQLGFQTKQNYSVLIDASTRRTRRLNMPADPSCVNRTDVKKVFEVVWKTLEYMGKQNYAHTPLAGRSVGFRGKRRVLEELITEL